MRNGSIRWSLIGLFAACFATGVFAQPAATQDVETRARRNAIEAELQSIAVVERRVMVPMRDGQRVQAGV